MSDVELLALIEKHRSRGVVVDANLLLVYWIGLCDPDWIPKFKRTQQFEQDDFIILHAFISKFDRIVSSPGILTEVNSLSNQLKSDHKQTFFSIFKNQISILDEKHVPSRQVSEHRFFTKTGLTDTAIMAIASEGLLVLTDDFRLTGYLEKTQIDYVNFNHIRYISPA